MLQFVIIIIIIICLSLLLFLIQLFAYLLSLEMPVIRPTDYKLPMIKEIWIRMFSL